MLALWPPILFGFWREQQDNKGAFPLSAVSRDNSELHNKPVHAVPVFGKRRPPAPQNLRQHKMEMYNKSDDNSAQAQ